jgi:predicted peroxiredoxin
MDTTGKFFAFIGVCVTLFLSWKGVEGMMKEQEEKLQEARDDGMRAAQKHSL